MTEEEYFAGAFSDDYLDAQADAGEYHLDEEGMLDLPTDEWLNLQANQGFIRLWIEKPPFWK
jgi:hypothetical protein